MTRTLPWMAAALVMVVALAAAQQASAQNDVDYRSSGEHRLTNWNVVSEQFATMQAEIDDLRAQVADSPNTWGDDCGCDDCGTCCPIGCGWYAGFEWVIVKPHFEDGVDFVVNANDRLVRTEPRYDFNVSPRVWVGARNATGLGGRIRWWNYDQNTDVLRDDTDDADFERHRIDVTALDLEATQLLLPFAPMELTLAGGFRYGRLDTTATLIDIDDNDIVESGADFEGFGPTVAIDVRRPCGFGHLALVGNCRGSLLFGEAKFFNRDFDRGQFESLEVREDRDTLAYVLESQLGVEWNHFCPYGGILSARVLMEGQIWAQASGGDTEDNDFTNADDDIGFFGITVGLIYAR